MLNMQWWLASERLFDSAAKRKSNLVSTKKLCEHEESSITIAGFQEQSFQYTIE
jgi:hypothetical protein